MNASFNDSWRCLDIQRGLTTGVTVKDALDVFVSGNTDNRAVCETIALYFLIIRRLGLCGDHLKIAGPTLVDKWLGDTRCPMCDKYWRSGSVSTVTNPSGVVGVNKISTYDKCPECGNTANETIMENGVLV